MPKDVFPKLLSKLVAALEEGNGAENLKAGFRKSEIFPLDVTLLLGRHPTAQTTQEGDAAAVGSSLIEMLKELRGTDKGPKRATKSKRIAVEPGKCVDAIHEDVDLEMDDDVIQTEVDQPSSSGTFKKRKLTPINSICIFFKLKRYITVKSVFFYVFSMGGPKLSGLVKLWPSMFVEKKFGERACPINQLLDDK